MNTLKDRYDALGPTVGPTLWDTIHDVLVQDHDADTYSRLLGSVKTEGRYKERASGAARKPRGSARVAVIDPMESAESYIRPNGQAYFARMWGEHGDVAALRKAREVTSRAFTSSAGSPMFVMLYGAPGCGKTALVEAAFGEDMRTILGTGDTETADMVGGYIQTPSGASDWRDGDLITCAINGWPYFIDEIGLIDPKVLSTLYGLMDGRREITVTANPDRGVVKAHPDFYVVAATNPNAPGVRLSEALLSRFTVQVEMTTDWNLARKLGVPTTMVTAAQNLAKKQLSHEVSWAPQFRELLAFRDVSAEFGQEWAIANLIAASPEIDRPVVSDVIGRAFGIPDLKPAVI